MKLLLHVCCGPCSIYPIGELQKKDYELSTYFYNPNIHPFKEFQRRLSTLKDYLCEIDVPLIADENYGLTEFVRKAAFNEEKKCLICYKTRLQATVEMAKKEGFEAFTTTLLYSKYQQHSVIVAFCTRLADENGLSFIYEDFREGWQQGIDESKTKKMYRQPYCGCIYSEQERYDKTLAKK